MNIEKRDKGGRGGKGLKGLKGVKALTPLPPLPLLPRLFVFCCLLLASAPLHASDNQIENVVVTESDGGVLVIIESQQPLKYFTTETSNPPAILIHFSEEVLNETGVSGQKGAGILKNVQYNHRSVPKTKIPTRLLDSVALILNEKPVFEMTQKDWTLSVKIKPAATTVPLERPTMAEALSYGFGIEGDVPQMALPENPRLDDFIKVGLANFHPLEIARKELKYADKKLFESRRTFFPAVSGRATESKGTTQADPNDPATQSDFTRREIGVEFGQPIFQSGRIYYSMKQSRAQKEIAELKINKIILETTYDIRKILFTYLQLKESLEIRKDLLKKVQKIVETTRKKKEIGVASESEYLGTQVAESQVEYKELSHEKDLEIAKTNLLAVLFLQSLPESISIKINDFIPQTPPASVSLDDWTTRALANRPEIRIADVTAKLKKFSSKVARAENLLKVDASAFLGQSGAAFKDEALNLQDSYNVGVKAVLYFGGSSVSPFASKEKTAPDLGNNTRTETTAQTVTLGLLDSLAARSNYYQAEIEVEKAKQEFRITKRDIMLEVREAFYNYQKAKIQLDAAKKELEFRKKEAIIAETKDRLHQIEATQLIQAITAQKESEINLNEASAFIVIATFALEKASGSKIIQ